MTSILPATQLVGLPASELAFYGLKAAGYADLLAAQAESPAAYLIPDAWAIPAQVGGMLDGAELRTAFENLTQGRRTKEVMMARSSSMQERPGENPTLMRTFNPADLDGSFVRFAGAVDEVRNTAPHMGVLATMAVGGVRVFGPGDERFGWDSVSFIADSHSPLNPDEMFFAFVHGLGTRVVEGGGEVIQVAVDRRTREITGFVNKNRRKISEFGGGSILGPGYINDYAQQRADYFDLVTGTIHDAGLDSSLAHEPHLLVLANGKLLGERDVVPSKGDVTYLNITPFEDPQMVYNLIDILIYLSNIFGPVQIEGAFGSRRKETPHLYQLIKVPAEEVAAAPLSVENLFLTAGHVIGRGIFEGPLLVYTKVDYVSDRMFANETLSEMDARFAASGYALLSDDQLLGICKATPNARVRLSGSFENPSSHVATLMRILTRESPERGYMFAMEVKQHFERKPDEVVGPVHIYHRARITSNGKELAVELI